MVVHPNNKFKSSLTRIGCLFICVNGKLPLVFSMLDPIHFCEDEHLGVSLGQIKSAASMRVQY